MASEEHLHYYVKDIIELIAIGFTAYFKDSNNFSFFSFGMSTYKRRIYMNFLILQPSETQN